MQRFLWWAHHSLTALLKEYYKPIGIKPKAI